MHEMPESDRPLNVRVESLEERVNSLEQAGQEDLPPVSLPVVELRLDHIEQGMRDFREEVNRRFGEVDKRIEGTTNRLTLILGLCTGIITLAVVLSQLFLP